MGSVHGILGPNVWLAELRRERCSAGHVALIVELKDIPTGGCYCAVPEPATVSSSNSRRWGWASYPMRVLIASGSGRYADPWHPFERTTPLLAEIIESVGFAVDIDDDVDHALTQLEDIDLLVVNAGDPWRDADPVRQEDLAASQRGLAAAFERGMGVLAMHSAISSLRDYADWYAAIGGMWVPSLSFHPPASSAKITSATTDSLGTFEEFVVYDEMYSRLQMIGRSEVVAAHVSSLGPEPLAWVRRHAASRIAVDVLGHDERSFDSDGHRQLVSKLARWAAQDTLPC